MSVFNLLATIVLWISVFAASSNAKCYIHWLKAQDTNVGNGVNVPAVNVTDCQARCLVNTTCNGVDWNPYELVGRQCWMSGPWSWGGSKGQAYGCTHYSLIRSIDCPECSNIWTLTMNTNVNGGNLVQSASNLQDCQLACITQNDCSGIDWNPASSIGRRCWLLWPWSGTRNNGTSLGVAHYDLIRVPGCPLVGTVAVGKNGGYVSVDPDDMSLSLTTNQDEALVLVTVDCLATSLFSQNFSSQLSSMDARCVSMYPPDWPGFYVRAKHGRLYIENQTEEEMGQIYSNRFAQDASFIIQNDLRNPGFSFLLTSSDMSSVIAWNGSMGANMADVRVDASRGSDTSSGFYVVPALTKTGPITTSCPNMWSRIDKVGVSNGGVFLPEVTDDSSCRQMCIAYPNCTGVSYNTTGCYLAIWTAGGQPVLKFNAMSVHWDLTRTSYIGPCTPGCVYNWALTTVTASNVIMFPWSQSNTDYECRSECIQTPGCNGIILTNNNAIGSCRLVEIKESAWSPFVSNTTTTTMNVLLLSRALEDCGECGVSIGLISGWYDSAAVPLAQLNNRQDCYTACVNDQDCIGIEMRQHGGASTNSSGNSTMAGGTVPANMGVCHHSLWSGGSMSLKQAADGMTHTDIQRSNCGSGCANKWIYYKDTNMTGVTPYPGANNEYQCRQACSLISTCSGINWDSRLGMCYHASASSTFQQFGTAMGRNHFSFVKGAMCE